MNVLFKHLDILPLVHKHSVLAAEPADVDKPSYKPVNSKEQPHNPTLNKEELRLLVKILKAIGHTCEHRHIRLKDGITHYQFNNITLVFDDVHKADEDRIMHLSPLSLMLKDPGAKRPTWEKLKTLNK